MTWLSPFPVDPVIPGLRPRAAGTLAQPSAPDLLHQRVRPVDQFLALLRGEDALFHEALHLADEVLQEAAGSIEVPLLGVLANGVLDHVGQGTGLAVVDVDFKGDSTHAEAERVAQIVKSEGADISIAVGGGKTLDTAKAAAASTGTKIVTIPTIASNDSPTSSYTVWYDEEGKFINFESWGVNPDLVLVDTQVIANGPVTAFVAGMGDALGTNPHSDL